MSGGELLAQIARNPDDPSAYLVWADALLEAGDPRGELVIVQHQLEAHPEHAALRAREALLFARHGKEWRGTLDRHRRALVLRWERGAIHGARVLVGGRASGASPRAGNTDRGREALAALLATPTVASTLAELALGPFGERDQESGTPPGVEALVGDLLGAWPPALRRLTIGAPEPHGARAAVAVPAIPHALDALTIAGDAIALAERPTVARLALRGRVDSLPDDAWPELRALELWHATPAQLALLEPHRFPALRELILVAPLDARALLTAPITAQLATLAIRGGTLLASDLRALAALPPALALDVRGNYLPPMGARDLASARGADAISRISPQRRLKSDDASAKVAGILEPAERRALDRAIERALDESRGDLARNAVELVELAEPAPRLRLRLARALAREALLVELGRLADAAHAEALASAQLGGPGLAELCLELARGHAAGETPQATERAEAWAHRATALADRDNARTTDDARGLLATLALRRGDLRTATAAFEALATSHAANADDVRELWATHHLAKCLVRADPERAQQLLDRALVLAQARRDLATEAAILGDRAAILANAGDREAADRLLAKAAALGATGPSPNRRP